MSVLDEGIIDMGDWPIAGAHVVYQIFDFDQNRPVYVGVTNDLIRRIGQHRSGRFRHGFHRITWAEYDSRREAAATEQQLIYELDPPMNIMGVPRHGPFDTDAERSTKLRLLGVNCSCDRCQVG